MIVLILKKEKISYDYKIKILTHHSSIIIFIK